MPYRKASQRREEDREKQSTVIDMCNTDIDMYLTQYLYNHFYILSKYGQELSESSNTNLFDWKEFDRLCFQLYSKQIYQIKRLADYKNHSPIAGVMQYYILGFKPLEALKFFI